MFCGCTPNAMLEATVSSMRFTDCGTNPIDLAPRVAVLAAKRHAVDQHSPGVRRQQPEQDVERRRLARARRSHHADEIAGGYLSVRPFRALPRAPG